MSERRTLIVTGLVVVLIIALILGVVWYLFNFIRARQTTQPATSDIFPRSSNNIVVNASSDPNSGQTIFPTTAPSATNAPGASKTPSSTPTPTLVPTPTVSQTNPNLKVYSGPGFTLAYPKN